MSPKKTKLHKPSKIQSFLILLLSLLISLGVRWLLDFPSPNSDQKIQRNQEKIQVTSSLILQESLEKDSLYENEAYTSKQNVAEYIKTYHKLPPNFLTKKEAFALGWEPKKGNLRDIAKDEPFAEYRSIGGDVFKNYEGILPQKKELKYFECDVNYNGGRRTAERLVYSNQWEIYYTKDHYKSFEKVIFKD